MDPEPIKICNAVFLVLGDDDIIGASTDTFCLPRGRCEIIWHLVHISAESRTVKFLPDAPFSLQTLSALPEGITKDMPEIDMNGSRLKMTIENQSLEIEPFSFDYFLGLDASASNLQFTWRHDPSIVVLPDPNTPG